MKFSVCVILVATTLAITTTSVRATPIIEALPSGGTPIAMNASGHLAGYRRNPIEIVAVKSTAPWGGGGSVVTIADAASQAFGINDAGQIVGNIVVGTGGRGSSTHPFAYTDGNLVDLGIVGGSITGATANDINNFGAIVGTTTTSTSGVTRAFRYTGTPGSGTFTDLGLFGGISSGASAVNDAGNIVVNWKTSDNVTHHGLYNPAGAGTLTSLSLIPASVLNEANEVAGGITVDGINHPARYVGDPTDGGYVADLGLLRDGFWGYGIGINNAGVVVGTSLVADSTGHAFVYAGVPGAGGHMIDLDAWLDTVDPVEGAKWTLTVADCINDNNIICGSGLYGGNSAIFRLDVSGAIPEPTLLSLFPLAIFALSRRKVECRG